MYMGRVLPDSAAGDKRSCSTVLFAPCGKCLSMAQCSVCNAQTVCLIVHEASGLIPKCHVCRENGDTGPLRLPVVAAPSRRRTERL